MKPFFIRAAGATVEVWSVYRVQLSALGFYMHHGYVAIATPMELPVDAGFGRLQPTFVLPNQSNDP